MNKLIGQLVVCGFAAIWAWNGVSALHGPAWLAPLALTPSLLIPLFGWLRPTAESEKAPDAGRAFAFVVVLEAAGIFLAVNLAVNLHHPELIMPAIALIVGLHFLPLAKIFGYPTYRLTGLVLCGLAICSLFIGGDAKAVVLGVGAAATLWLTMLMATLGKPVLARA